MQCLRAYSISVARACSKACTAFLLAIFLIALTCCSAENDSDSPAESETLDIPGLYSTASAITVQVAYEPGAEPYTGFGQTGERSFSVFGSNIEALFEGRSVKPNVSVPDDLSGMTEIPEQNKDLWAGSEILDLASGIWTQAPVTGNQEVHVLYLNGYLESDGNASRQVMGVSFTGTEVIAVFKAVVDSSGLSPVVSRYVEQATLVHEFGHIAGLVNNGVPMVTPHEDPNHPHHCTNPSCIMYWLNEGASDMREFALQAMNTGSPVMYGSECLNDCRSYIP